MTKPLSGAQIKAAQQALEEFAQYFETTGSAIGLEPNVVKAVPAIVRSWAAGHYGATRPTK